VIGLTRSGFRAFLEENRDTVFDQNDCLRCALAVYLDSIVIYEDDHRSWTHKQYREMEFVYIEDLPRWAQRIAKLRDGCKVGTVFGSLLLEEL